MNTEITPNLKQLYNNPTFRNAFMEYVKVMQKEGFVAMFKFWEMFPRIEKLIENYPLLMEQMMRYYSIIGALLQDQNYEATSLNQINGSNTDPIRKVFALEGNEQFKESVISLCNLYSKEKGNINLESQQSDGSKNVSSSNEGQSQDLYFDFMNDVVSKIACKLTEQFENTLNNIVSNK